MSAREYNILTTNVDTSLRLSPITLILSAYGLKFSGDLVGHEDDETVPGVIRITGGLGVDREVARCWIIERMLA